MSTGQHSRARVANDKGCFGGAPLLWPRATPRADAAALSQDDVLADTVSVLERMFEDMAQAMEKLAALEPDVAVTARRLRSIDAGLFLRLPPEQVRALLHDLLGRFGRLAVVIDAAARAGGNATKTH